MTDDDLDAMLAVPLGDMADAGFSSRVLSRVTARTAWRERLTMYAPVAAAAAVIPFLPGAQFAHAAVHLTPLIADSGAIAIAAAALALTMSLDQRFRETG
jgi:hypothetical protein